MVKLIQLFNNVPMVGTKDVAKKFNKVHAKVVRDIEKLECSPEFKHANFGTFTFTNKNNVSYDGYMMTKDGFAFLCMGFTGKDAAAWKEKYISAFNRMEKQQSRKEKDIQWIAARSQVKAIRREVTDTIKDFVEYANKQGSKSATRYYGSITKMEYAALELLQFSEKVPDKFRDTLDSMQLAFLMTAEYVAKNAIQHGMDEGLHYKEIYILAKDSVYRNAETVRITTNAG